MLLLCLTLNVSAVDLEGELAIYEREALELRLRPLDTGHELRRRGMRLKLGAFGQGGDQLFAPVPEALRDLGKYRALKVGGIVALCVGLAALAADGALLILSAVRGRPVDVPLFVSLLVIGLDVAGAGIGFVIFAPNYLQRAVSVYNESMVARALAEQR